MNKDHSKLTGPIWGAHIFQFDSDTEEAEEQDVIFH